jgi:hypothetical protein
MTSITRTLATGLLFALALGTASGQDKKHGPLRDLFRRQNAAEITILIDTTATPIFPPEPLEVPNRSDVRVRVKQKPVNKCVVESQRAEIAEEPNPLATILGLFMKAVTGVREVAPPPAPPPPPPPECPGPKVSPPPNSPDAALVEGLLEDVQASVRVGYYAMVDERRKHEEIAESIKNFIGCKDDKGKDICGSAADFDSAKDALKQKIR